MNGMDEWQRKTNERMAGPPDAESPAALRERIAELQYEAGMYQSLYENAVKMNRDEIEELRTALFDLLACAESECVSGSSYDPIEAAKAILSGVTP